MEVDKGWTRQRIFPQTVIAFTETARLGPFNILADNDYWKVHRTVFTEKEDVLCSLQFNVEWLMPCNHEEADTQIVLLVRHIVAGGTRSNNKSKCHICLVVCYVNLVSKSFGFQLVRTCFCWENGLGKSISITLFYTFTGFGVASAFRGTGESCLAKWNVYSEASPVCTKLSKILPMIGKEEQNVLEKFIITMYERSSHAIYIDDIRLDMFARKQRLYDTKPLTLIKLVQNTKKSCIPSRLHLESIETMSNIYWKPY